MEARRIGSRLGGGWGGGKVVMDGVEVEGRVNKEIDERRDRD